jgi:hypothetical protein
VTFLVKLYWSLAKNSLRILPHLFYPPFLFFPYSILILPNVLAGLLVLHWLCVRGISRKAKMLEWGNWPTPHRPREFFGRLKNIYNVDLTMNYLYIKEWRGKYLGH